MPNNMKSRVGIPGLKIETWGTHFSSALQVQ